MNKLNYIALPVMILLSACGGSAKQEPESIEPSAPEIVVSPPEPSPEPISTTPEPIIAPELSDDITDNIDLTLLAPTSLKYYLNNNTVLLTWDAVPDASSYKISYSENGNISVFNSETNHFKQRELSKSIHSYRVHAVFDDSMSKASMLVTVNLLNEAGLSDTVN